MTDSISDKVQHVKSAAQTRDHTCHWPGCGKQVKPAVWGCAPHWYRLPQALRNRIWRTYAIGQEDGKRGVSRDYVEAAEAVQAWIREHGGPV